MNIETPTDRIDIARLSLEEPHHGAKDLEKGFYRLKNGGFYDVDRNAWRETWEKSLDTYYYTEPQLWALYLESHFDKPSAREKYKEIHEYYFKPAFDSFASNSKGTHLHAYNQLLDVLVRKQLGDDYKRRLHQLKLRGEKYFLPPRYYHGETNLWEEPSEANPRAIFYLSTQLLAILIDLPEKRKEAYKKYLKLATYFKKEDEWIEYVDDRNTCRGISLYTYLLQAFVEAQFHPQNAHLSLDKIRDTHYDERHTVWRIVEKGGYKHAPETKVQCVGLLLEHALNFTKNEKPPTPLPITRTF